MYICLSSRFDVKRLPLCNFLFTHADRRGVDISFTVLFVSLFVCTVTDFSAEDKASGVKFFSAILQRPSQGISHFSKLRSRRSPKSDESESARATPTRM